MTPTTRRVIATLLFAACASNSAWAEDPADVKPAESNAADAKPAIDIGQLIKDLDHDKFSVRDQATNKLADTGETAIDAVAEAALSDSREVATRSIDILKRLMQSQHTITKDKAKQALEKLAQATTNEATARRAAQALKPDPPIPVGRPVPAINRIQIGGNLQLPNNVQIAVNGNNRVIKIQNVNGRRTIEVTENGRKVEIVDDPQQGIDMSITEKVDGNDKTEKYAAKDADELKKKHPEAAKIYEQYKAGGIPGGGIIAVQVQANGVPGQAPQIRRLAPNFIPPPQFVPNALPGAVPNVGQAAAPIADARKLLAEAAEALKSPGADDEAGRAARQKTLDQVQAADRKLAEAEEKLGK